MTMHFAPVSPEAGTKRAAAQRAAKNAKLPPAAGPYRSFFKRSLDILFTLIAAPFILLLITLLTVLISMDGSSPFYTQKRLGKDGRTFRIWKLRTMIPNADQLLESYLAKDPVARQEWMRSQKLKNDPRVTWIGKFLRKTSMDELPQFLNIVNGSMSLVGPRPIMLCQAEDYTGTSYYNLVPGITGLWQVSDRNECEFTGRVYYDDLYDRTMSLKTDLWVIWRTVFVVLRGTGY
jgi:exopolysaccharide production protein ExoY